MTRVLFLAGVVVSFAALGCDSGDGTAGTGGTAGAGGVAGVGGTGGTGGAGGTAGLGFASIAEVVESGLSLQLARCQCPDPARPDEPENTCLVSGANLRFSDRQVACFDGVAAGDETLRNRFDCLLRADLDATTCVEAVIACDAAALTACDDALELAQDACPEPTIDVIRATAPCYEVLPEDVVDAYLDSLVAQCDCATGCTSSDLPGADVETCMIEAVRAEAEALGEAASEELRCENDTSRALEVCFWNETTCDGPTIACGLPSLTCAIRVGAAFRDCTMP